MILDPGQIRAILLAESPKFINDAVAYSKKMRLHFYGTDLDSAIMQIKGFERDAAKELRVQYAKSNKDLFSRLSRPMDRIFSAKGGSFYYNLSDKEEKEAIAISNNVRSGMSIKKWLEVYWMPHMADDPNGVLFMEILPQREAILAKRQGKSIVYPTYKSSGSVFNYEIRGNKVEWIVLKVSNAEKIAAGIDVKDQVYRVVDDAFDYYVKRDMQDIVIMGGQYSLPNFFGEVPAIINSDIVAPECEDLRLSFFDKAIELAEMFLLKSSIKTTHDFLHGFPKYSEFADDCSKCNGTGYMDAEKCPECKGSGKRVMTKVSDIKLLAFPGKEDHLVLPSQVGGYISPDKTFHEISTADLLDLENAMSITIWGVESQRKKIGTGSAPTPQEKTATQVVSEVRPEADRLHVITEMAETRHKFILDSVIRLNINNNYSGASVSYGRRYMLESTDALWSRYMDARVQGSPQNVLDDMLVEYYETKYMSDPVALALAKKLMYVEPFVHYTAEKLQLLKPAEEDYKGKLYYSEWLALQNDAVLLVTPVDLLKQQLADYVKPKQMALPTPDPKKAVLN